MFSDYYMQMLFLYLLIHQYEEFILGINEYEEQYFH